MEKDHKKRKKNKIISTIKYMPYQANPIDFNPLQDSFVDICRIIEKADQDTAVAFTALSYDIFICISRINSNSEFLTKFFLENKQELEKRYHLTNIFSDSFTAEFLEKRLELSLDHRTYMNSVRKYLDFIQKHVIKSKIKSKKILPDSFNEVWKKPSGDIQQKYGLPDSDIAKIYPIAKGICDDLISQRDSIQHKFEDFTHIIHKDGNIAFKYKKIGETSLVEEHREGYRLLVPSLIHINDQLIQLNSELIKL